MNSDDVYALKLATDYLYDLGTGALPCFFSSNWPLGRDYQHYFCQALQSRHLPYILNWWLTFARRSIFRRSSLPG